MTAADMEALGLRAEAMLRELGGISAEADRLVRLFLTPEHRRAADLVARWMRDAGMTVSEDALGTVRGHYGQGRRLLIGSHIDSVVDGGLYDGNLGVVAGILAAERLTRAGQSLPFAIGVLAFGDEEGSRFPATLHSSLACAGAFPKNALLLQDAAGVSLGQALQSYGKDPAAIPDAAYRPQEVMGYVEVHIEQGPVLEARNQPLGVVSGIVGQSYLHVEMIGEAGHAGTVPLPLRRDALAGAAEAVLMAERLARESDGAVLATVGRLEVKPGASNVIPGRVAFVLDARSGNDVARARLVAEFEVGCRAIAARRQLEVTLTPTREVPTTPCDAHLQDVLSAAVADIGGEPVLLASGAGHDGQAMAKLCPVAMLFVRCRGGISHNPAEYASPQDMGAAIAALIRFIERLSA